MQKYIALFVTILLLLININVNAQVDQLKGMSQEELQKKAKALGISQKELLKYEQQMQSNRKVKLPSPKVTLIPDTSVISTPPASKPSSLDTLPAFQGGSAASLPAFGYNIFNYSPTTFLPTANVPTPMSYIFGPGDEIIITLWGETQLVHDVVVSKNGDINIPDVGMVDVNGLSLGALNEVLFKKLSKVYASLVPVNGVAKTHMNISTGKLRSVKIYVLGEVNKPGGYVLPALSTAFTALYYCGGPDLNGSLRNVEVLRKGKKVADIDMYNYLINGDQSGDVRLEDEDVLFIPPVGKRVAIEGSVFRPAIYELKKGENLSSLEKFAGGLTFNAFYRRVHIERVIPFNQRNEYTNNILSIDLNFKNVNELKNSNFSLDDGDIVDILSINKLPQNRVVIRGDVRKPGVYGLTNSGMTIRDLVFRADSLFPDAFLDKALLIRTLPSEKREIISFNLKKALEGDPANNLILKNRDQIHIYKITNFYPERSIEISGAVNHPGNYTRMDNMTLTDLIMQAGGLADTASYKNIEITRLDTTQPGVYYRKYTVNIPYNYWDLKKDKDFKLADYDRVLVKTDTSKVFGKTVTVAGQVNFPGTYSILYRGEKLSDFIRRAGGFKPTAYTAAMYLKRTNPEINLFQKIKIPDSLLFNYYSNQVAYDKSLFDKELASRIPINWNDIETDSASIYNLVLNPGDKIVVPKNNGTLTVLGDVNIPSTVPYKKGGSVSYYIKQAGGYTNTSAKGDEVVILPNGKKWRPSGWFFIPNPEILSGSTIIVPTKIETRSDTWPVIRDIITVVSSTAVLVLSIRALTK